MKQGRNCVGRKYEILDEGHGIRWPEIDEDISVRGMLEGTPAHRS